MGDPGQTRGLPASRPVVGGRSLPLRSWCSPGGCGRLGSGCCPAGGSGVGAERRARVGGRLAGCRWRCGFGAVGGHRSVGAGSSCGGADARRPGCGGGVDRRGSEQHRMVCAGGPRRARGLAVAVRGGVARVAGLGAGDRGPCGHESRSGVAELGCRHRAAVLGLLGCAVPDRASSGCTGRRRPRRSRRPRSSGSGWRRTCTTSWRTRWPSRCCTWVGCGWLWARAGAR